MDDAGTVSLEADDLRRDFGDQTAVDGVDLSLSGQQIVGVAGPNGAGKTTLMRLFLGLLSPTSGTATVNGHAPESLSQDDREAIGYMPQRRGLYDDLTVRGNVSFFASLYDADDGSGAVDRALDIVDLHDRADDLVATLSGGMVRRTSLACAIVHEPAVLFLDEPTVGLDPELRAAMWDTFRAMRDDGALIVISTHYLGEARNCDRVLFLRDGRVLALDSPQRFLERTETSDLEEAFLTLLARQGPEDES